MNGKQKWLSTPQNLWPQKLRVCSTENWTKKNTQKQTYTHTHTHTGTLTPIQKNEWFMYAYHFILIIFKEQIFWRIIVVASQHYSNLRLVDRCWFLVCCSHKNLKSLFMRWTNWILFLISIAVKIREWFKGKHSVPYTYVSKNWQHAQAHVKNTGYWSQNGLKIANFCRLQLDILEQFWCRKLFFPLGYLLISFWLQCVTVTLHSNKILLIFANLWILYRVLGS